jgi:outer membrane protein OmpA-like peptidoglycan-associated protein
VEGYTDSTGEASYNQGLSERRAEAVRDTLVDMGISRSRVETKGFGEQFPVASNDTSGGRQQNRRVEIVISDEEGNIKAREN